MLKGYKYRLYPDDDQKVLLSKHFGSCRWIYNWGLDIKQKAYKETGKSPTKFDLCLSLPLLKKQKETEWLKEVGSQSLQASLEYLDNAFNGFFNKRTKYPIFKSKHSSKQSFTIPSGIEIDFDHGRIWLPKFKEAIKIKLSRKIEGEIRKSIVSKNSSGEYYISVIVEDRKNIPDKVIIAGKEDILGIDVGIKYFCVTSDGEIIENQKFLRSKQKRLKLLQIKMSHKQKGSNNRAKDKLKVARFHQKIVNKRIDFLHKLSFRLVSENKAIAREDLNVKGMLKNHKLANAISDVAWSKFDSMLKYKSEWYGKHFLEIGRFEPSSKMCNVCGHYHDSLTLDDRTWICEKCGSINDRDFNASLNIRDFAFISFIKDSTQGHGEVKSVRLKSDKKSKSKDEVASGQKEIPVMASNSEYVNILKVS